jgi:hypothetical protein
LFDQLYWTADQLQLRQLASIIWVLGRLQLVAVPQELLERLLAFTRMQLQPLLLQQQQQQQRLPAGGGSEDESATGSSSGRSNSSSSSSSSSSSRKMDAAAQYQLSKHIFKLLLGLAGLRKQLPRSMLQQAGVSPAWVIVVVLADGPLSRVHVPACLHAAAVLRLRLPGNVPAAAAAASAAWEKEGEAAAVQDEAAAVGTAELLSLQQQQQQSCQAAVLARLSGLRPSLSHSGLALGLWGVVGLGCRPDSAWLKTWLDESQQLLQVASAAEINMLLHSCVLLRHAPDSSWMLGVFRRLRQLLAAAAEQQGSSSSRGGGAAAAVGLSGSSMVATLKCLIALQRQQQQQQQQQQGTVKELDIEQKQQQQSLQLLLQQMSLRMERLEIAGVASPTAVRQFQEYAAALQKSIAAA